MHVGLLLLLLARLAVGLRARLARGQLQPRLRHKEMAVQQRPWGAANSRQTAALSQAAVRYSSAAGSNNSTQDASEEAQPPFPQPSRRHLIFKFPV